MIDRQGLRWYREATICRLHAKFFFAANNHGIGDLGGVTGKFDYIDEPGARRQDMSKTRLRAPKLRVDGPQGS